MANLRKVIYINEEDYSTLINGDSLVIDGTTYTYEENALYVIKNAGPPEYAETAGYATNAGTSQVALADANGNSITATYEKKPLIIEVQDDELPSEDAFDDITEALQNGRIVYLQLYRAIADENTLYLRLTNDGLNEDGYYHFSGYCEGSLVDYAIGPQRDWEFNFNTPVSITGTETITGNKTFTGTVSLGSNATATTPAATDNDTSVATTAFVKTVVANSINELPSPMIFKGSLGTGGTITSLPAATTSNEGYTYKVITNGTYGGQSAKIGDTFISDGSNWIYIPSGDEPSGTVTNVKIQATSPIAIDDSSAITTSGTRTISHNDSGVTAGTYKSVTVDTKGHVTAGTNPTTLAGYGITDAKIQNGVITLGSNTITPLTSFTEIDPTVQSWAKNTIDFLNSGEEPSSGTKLIFDSSTFKNSTTRTNILISLKTDGNSIINGVLDETSDTYPWNNSSLHVLATNRFLQPIIDAKAPSQSPALTGTPTAPTAAAGTNTTQIATTAFVQTAINNKTHYWANLQTTSAANYIAEPEVKSVKINGSSTNSASTENAVIQYDTTNKCIKFVFN